MYLHGGSLRGDDIEKVRTLGLPHLIENDKSFPFIVVSPLCPAGEIWTDSDMLIGILDEVISRYAIDEKRVYLTGHSMGGRGTLYLANKYPQRFAAIVALSPISTIPAWAIGLKTVPVWIIHGRKDKAAPIEDSEAMVQALKAVGGDVTFTPLSDRDPSFLIYMRTSIYTSGWHTTNVTTRMKWICRFAVNKTTWSTSRNSKLAPLPSP